MCWIGLKFSLFQREWWMSVFWIHRMKHWNTLGCKQPCLGILSMCNHPCALWARLQTSSTYWLSVRGVGSGRTAVSSRILNSYQNLLGDSEIHGEICWSLNTHQWLSRSCATHLYSLAYWRCSVALGLHHVLYTCTLYWNDPFSMVCSATHKYGRIGMYVVGTLPWL